MTWLFAWASWFSSWGEWGRLLTQTFLDLLIFKVRSDLRKLAIRISYLEFLKSLHLGKICWVPHRNDRPQDFEWEVDILFLNNHTLFPLFGAANWYQDTINYLLKFYLTIPPNFAIWPSSRERMSFLKSSILHKFSDFHSLVSPLLYTLVLWGG